MKYLTTLFLSSLLLCACGENSGANLKDPSNTHPPSEAIPDSMQIVSDSAIIPDTVPDGGAQVGASDSIHQNR